MMYSDHARKRMKQRGITELDIEHVFAHHEYIKKSFEERKEVGGRVKNRLVRVFYVEGESYIRIISVR